jgi:hypothetical protein
MSKKKRFLSRSMGSTQITPSASSAAASRETSSSYYSSISDIPLRNFIECIVNANLSQLVISGFPSKEELQTAWGKIRMEYAEASKDPEYRLYIRLYKDLNLTIATIAQIENMIAILSSRYVKRFADQLNELLSSTFVFDISNLEDYDRKLQICHNKTGALRLRKMMLEKQYNAIAEKHEEHKPATKQYYHAILISLSDQAGYQIQDTITVFEFCERINRANERNEMLKKHAHARK